MEDTGIRSCCDCVHFEMCKWKGEPYMGSSSDGFPAKNFSDYRIGWYKLHGRSCEQFRGEPDGSFKAAI